MTIIDANTAKAVTAFLNQITSKYPVSRAILFGSRARGTFRADSDADIAVLLRGAPGQRVDIALGMADIAFDVLLETETGVLVEALPLWEEEWDHPECFTNPALIENIQREGVCL